MIKLYSYARSSAAFRVRIALELKNLDYEYIPINLAQNEHFSSEYASINSEKLVPALEINGQVLSQSMAIIEYLDELDPTYPLLPKLPEERQRVRAMAQYIACEIHPLNNLRVLRHLVQEAGFSEQKKLIWYRHWVELGLKNFEHMLSQSRTEGSKFCIGHAPTMVECLLIPQLTNALRFEAKVAEFPQCLEIYHHCMSLSAFDKAKPENCPDFKPN